MIARAWGFESPSQEYRERVARLKESYEVSEVLSGAKPPGTNEVSVTADGRRLDTPEAVVAFFDALRAERQAAQSVDG